MTYFCFASAFFKSRHVSFIWVPMYYWIIDATWCEFWARKISRYVVYPLQKNRSLSSHTKMLAFGSVRFHFCTCLLACFTVACRTPPDPIWDREMIEHRCTRCVQCLESSESDREKPRYGVKPEPHRDHFKQTDPISTCTCRVPRGSQTPLHHSSPLQRSAATLTCNWRHVVLYAWILGDWNSRITNL